MCRWLAYTGSPILLEELLFKTDVSLIDQSLLARRAETPTNGDGFGIGWYGDQPEPGLYRHIRPAWNDDNLRDLAAHIESSLFLAHVRAAHGSGVQRSNCHPFRHGRWLFVHNGHTDGFEEMKRDLVLAIAPDLYPLIRGTTDSEIMFYLALTHGLEQDPLGALQMMAGEIEEIARSHGVEAPLHMTFGVSDGERLMAVRYASAGPQPTLYHSADMRALSQMFCDTPRQPFSEDARVIVSEPLTELTEIWVEIPESSCVEIIGDRVIRSPFVPCVPSPAGLPGR